MRSFISSMYGTIMPNSWHGWINVRKLSSENLRETPSSAINFCHPPRHHGNEKVCFLYPRAISEAVRQANEYFITNWQLNCRVNDNPPSIINE